MINLLFFNHFYPVTSYQCATSWKRKRRINCVRFGHSLWSAISRRRKWLKGPFELSVFRKRWKTFIKLSVKLKSDEVRSLACHGAIVWIINISDFFQGSVRRVACGRFLKRAKVEENSGHCSTGCFRWRDKRKDDRGSVAGSLAWSSLSVAPPYDGVWIVQE